MSSHSFVSRATPHLDFSKTHLASRHMSFWNATFLALILLSMILMTFVGQRTYQWKNYLGARQDLSQLQNAKSNWLQLTPPSKQYHNDDWILHQHVSGDNGADVPRVEFPGKLSSEFFGCDHSEFHTDVCNMRGNVYMDAKKSSFILFPSNRSTHLGEERVRPYSRKWEKNIMSSVHEVTLKSVEISEKDHLNLECQVFHKVPGVVFSTGGYTGNLCHDFNEVMIPLFISSQHLRGEVVFIIVDYHNWWISKYDEALKQLSNYPVINFENATRIHCFPEVLVGLFYHSEMAIEPARMPHNETIHDFRAMFNQAYTSSLSEKNSIDSNKPRLVFMVRDGNRVILNQNQIVSLAEQIGFQVVIWKPDQTTMLKTTFRILNSSHVMMGVHGAALTHFFFMRPGSVFIQIVPLGIDWAAQTYFTIPATKFGLQYIEYKIKPEESSLSQNYAENDAVLTNPRSIVKQGWWAVKKTYLEGQNIQLSLMGMRTTLISAKRRALEFIKTEHMS